MAGVVAGCVNLAKTNDACAQVLLEKACELAPEVGCARLAGYYENGKIRPPDRAKAAQYEKRACEVGDGRSCFNAGLAYGRGQGVLRDDAVAADMDRRGCDAGHLGACFNFATSLRTGVGVPVDRARALTLYQRACEGTHELSPQACTQISRLQTGNDEIKTGRCKPDRAQNMQQISLGLKRVFDALSSGGDVFTVESTEILVATEKGTPAKLEVGMGGEMHLFAVAFDHVRST